MTLMLLMVVEIGVAMAIGFILGRIWQIRSDLEEQRAGGFTAPPVARMPRPAQAEHGKGSTKQNAGLFAPPQLRSASRTGQS